MVRIESCPRTDRKPRRDFWRSFEETFALLGMSRGRYSPFYPLVTLWVACRGYIPGTVPQLERQSTVLLSYNPLFRGGPDPFFDSFPLVLLMGSSRCLSSVMDTPKGSPRWTVAIVAQLDLLWRSFCILVLSPLTTCHNWNSHGWYPSFAPAVHQFL